VDCVAGLLVGVATLSLSAWLSRLYALPYALLIVMGVANLVYGAFSFSLARRDSRPRSLFVLLVMANGLWALLCGLAAVYFAGQASVYGLAHLLGEGLFVGGLAAWEWRQRERLLVAV
jgi:hypothetical protein